MNFQKQLIALSYLSFLQGDVLRNCAPTTVPHEGCKSEGEVTTCMCIGNLCNEGSANGSAKNQVSIYGAMIVVTFVATFIYQIYFLA